HARIAREVHPDFALLQEAEDRLHHVVLLALELYFHFCALRDLGQLEPERGEGRTVHGSDVPAEAGPFAAGRVGGGLSRQVESPAVGRALIVDHSARRLGRICILHPAWNELYDHRMQLWCGHRLARTRMCRRAGRGVLSGRDLRHGRRRAGTRRPGVAGGGRRRGGWWHRSATATGESQDPDTEAETV